jgi:hypothetical protein
MLCVRQDLSKSPPGSLSRLTGQLVRMLGRQERRSFVSQPEQRIPSGLVMPDQME